ncbi:amino acid adenylation domain-containing protein [Plantactinospora sp. GCM10030261]|uniref:non-ribosomal peptide synthetase n=1 Tax=Plantactinospora sp. GCM10030261 TaxID=3273420 RepID=UPI00360B79E0
MSSFPKQDEASIHRKLNEQSRIVIQNCIAELTALLAGMEPGPEPEVGPFPLTDLQQAYLIGEEGVARNASPALYIQEYAFGASAHLDIAGFADALARVWRTQPVMRTRITADARQFFGRVSDSDDPAELIEIVDRTTVRADEVDAELAVLRAALPEDVPDNASGRPFIFRFVRLPGGVVHLQVALRLTVFDGVTIQLLFAALAQCYADPAHRPAGDESYLDFLTRLETRRTTPEYRAAERYWHSRLDSMAPAPDLPRAPEDVGRPDVPLHRSGHRLPDDRWKTFRSHCAAHGISPGLALLTLYVECLLRWTGGRPGTVAVLASSRSGTAAVPDRMWGNAASTVLLGYEQTSGSFLDRCHAVRDRLYDDLAASEMSGVEVGRELNRRTGAVGNPVPVVFSSGIELVSGLADGFRLALPGGALVHGAIATPEVLLDHQAYEFGGDLVCNFDHDRSAYPPGMIDDLAEYHRQRLDDLAEDPSAWDRTRPAPLPETQLAARRAANRTGTPDLEGELHEAVIDRMRDQPDAVALIDEDRTLSYGELDRLSAALAVRLRAAGVGDSAEPGLVAVHLPKSWAQPVAVLAVLRAGGAYLPVSPTWPESRIVQVLRQSAAVAMITMGGTPPAGIPDLPTLAVSGNDTTVASGPDGLGGDRGRPAYVIYTSGSTGTPKGVVISHGAATNTLRDLTGRLDLSPRDRVLSVSALAFDLSVFDIFAILGAGGSVVIPRDSDVPEPEHWGRLCQAHGVTIWNSVPALLAMSLEYFAGRAPEMFGTLRLAMLSGDWIPLPLPGRIAAVAPGARVLAMGGATEASIWSNYFWADELPAAWSTVPYGRPLANQTMHVLDGHLADAPEWVPGDLYIGGIGVADGYHNAPDLTASSFLVDPATGERRYRTGDRARYRPGGVLEFLGRQDDQVKVGGHRIELGEIETRLLAHAAVRTAVAAVADTRGTPYLAAFVTPVPGRTPDPATLRDHLAAEVPSYMVPGVVQVTDELPLSANGKVDRKALLSRLAGVAPVPGGGTTGVPPRTPDESRLLTVWRELLGPEVRGVTDDFFSLGGNSLLAVRLFHRLKEEFGRTLPLSSLMRSRTVAEQARLFRSDDERQDTSPLVPIRDGDPNRVLVLVHPVGGDVLCYQPLVHALSQWSGPAGMTVYGLRALGLVPGEDSPASLVSAAERYAEEICRTVPGSAVVHLVGWSMGGVIAAQLASLLTGRGRRVDSVTAIDSFTGDPDAAAVTTAERVAGFFHDLAQGADVTGYVPDTATVTDLSAIQESLLSAGLVTVRLAADDLARLFAVYQHNSIILERHVPGPAPKRLMLLQAQDTRRDRFPALVPLREMLAAGPEPHWLPGDHYSVMTPGQSTEIAALVAAHTGAAESPSVSVLATESHYLVGKLWC